MGDYTPNLKFYKPDPSEFVDVNVQLNNNWDIADDVTKKLLEYEYTTAAVPNVTNSVSRPKFYKEYSNSIFTYFKGGNFFWQGPANTVNDFVSAKSWLADGWVEHHDMPFYVRAIKKVSGGTKTQIEWVGAIWMGNAFIDLNTTMVVIPEGGIPVAYRPVRTQYFTVSAGNTSTQYSIARLFISDTGRAEIRRYGVNPAEGSDENRIEFTGVRYDLNVTGT